MITIRAILSLLFFSVFNFISAQDVHIIDLSKETINISTTQVDFYIDEVIDSREDKSLGFVLVGRKDNLEIAEIRGGFQKGLESILKSSFPHSDGLKSISIEITSAEIKETILFSGQSAKAEIHLSIIINDSIIFTTSAIHEINAPDVTEFHAENLVLTLAKCLENYANNIISESKSSTTNDEIPYKRNDKNLEEPQSSKYGYYENRDIVAIGYQIGGLTLLGIDYTLRLSNLIGVHAGAGFAGYTFGLKFHFRPDRNSSFINTSYKDGGFGLINTIAAEYGGRVAFGSDSRAAFHYQVGLSYISHIDNDFEKKLFPNDNNPGYLLSIGVGISF